MDDHQFGTKGSGTSMKIPIILISLGLLSLAIGSFVGISRTEDQTGSNDLQNDLGELIISLKNNGPMKFDTFDPVSLIPSDPSYLEGRSALFKVQTYSGEQADLYYPDGETYQDMEDGDQELEAFLITLDMGDGRIVPGQMEVILRER